ncbi:MAG: LLM class flavin-dependent oxidoreductase, partial [Ilumatobacteraceae bacterium]
AATAQQISAGRFWLGIGAGASPQSRFGAEHAAVGVDLAAAVEVRHQRVVDFVSLAKEMWADGVVGGIGAFPVPPSPIPVIVGVNSTALARIAALHTDGINVRWNHPRLEVIVAAARAARADDAPPLLVTTWQPFEAALLDEDSIDRRRYAALGVDRLIVVRR